MLLAVGRHIPPGMTGIPVRTQRDIAGPAGALLGVPTPSVQGANLLADTTTVDIDESDHGTALPPGMRLEPGFPNPFNPSTTITVHLDARTRASLLVYDLLGRPVAVLARGEFPAGRSAYTWHAGGAAAGVYLCRLDAGARKASRKLLLTR